jgi:alkanesulfonate monooxygenase SsuD/methylene tetrahydromethanopterin reductase-like flavin-dependent oxidoreductase (luciferase family)
VQQAFLGVIRGKRTQLPPPVETMDGHWSELEERHVRRMTRCSAVGDPGTAREQLEEIISATGADEIIATAQIYDHAARLRSFELAAAVFQEINAASSGR